MTDVEKKIEAALTILHSGAPDTAKIAAARKALARDPAEYLAAVLPAMRSVSPPLADALDPFIAAISKFPPPLLATIAMGFFSAYQSELNK